MIKVGLLYLLLIFPVCIFAQTEETEKKEEEKKVVVVDSLYREDHFYISIAYNLLQNSPSGFSQNSFSLGLSTGFLRDIPLNKKRTFAIAPGIGYTFNSLRQNMKIMEENNVVNYSISSDFDRNKLEMHYLDIPVEVRWRTSTPESHKFWRVYSGFKFSYLMYSKSVYTGSDGKYKVTNNSDLNKIQYGPYVGIGYNTFNAYAFYGLNPLFKSGEIEGERIKINVFSFLVIFYIL